MATPRLCSIPNCGKPHEARGWCEKHYKRWRNHGNPLTLRKTDAGEPQRYLRDKVLRFNGPDCLLWPYARLPSGQGVVTISKKLTIAHRYVCEALHGPAPTSKHEVAHLCGNGHLGCVNPRHLRWATHTENMADQLMHGTRNRGSRNGQSKLVEGDIPVIRSLLRQGKTITEIGAQFDVSRGTIWQIAKGNSWAWVEP
jgi:hypothetical protein